MGWMPARSTRCWSSARCWAGTRSSSRSCATPPTPPSRSTAWRTSTRWESHTGDSIVVAPIQTLPTRSCSAAPLRAPNRARPALEGGCNVQLAVSPDGSDYRVIEVNRRVSRSSALASKATGYPIARVAALVGLGKRLDELPNPGHRHRVPPPSNRRSTTWWSSYRAGRSTSSRRRIGPGSPDEGHRRGDGHRSRVRAVPAQGGALAGAARPRLDLGGPGVGADASASGGHRTFLAPSDTRLWRMVGLLRHGWTDASGLSAATGIAPGSTERLAELVAAEQARSSVPVARCQAGRLRRRRYRCSRACQRWRCAGRACRPASRLLIDASTPVPASSRRNTVLLQLVRHRRGCPRRRIGGA